VESDADEEELEEEDEEDADRSDLMDAESSSSRLCKHGELFSKQNWPDRKGEMVIGDSQADSADVERTSN